MHWDGNMISRYLKRGHHWGRGQWQWGTNRGNFKRRGDDCHVDNVHLSHVDSCFFLPLITLEPRQQWNRQILEPTRTQFCALPPGDNQRPSQKCSRLIQSYQVGGALEYWTNSSITFEVTWTLARLYCTILLLLCDMSPFKDEQKFLLQRWDLIFVRGLVQFLLALA